MPNKNLIYVTPHLSTGGMPQYLLKQIQEFKDEFNIKVVEYNDHSGGAYIVQKNQIKDLVEVFTLHDNKGDRLWKIIQNNLADIVHFTEIPESFINHDTLNKIFDNTDRTYDIITSTHSSHTNPDDIKYHPDRYIMPCEWSKQQFNHLGIDTRVWEYPIENYRYKKEDTKLELGFEENYRHVLMVGLFTEGKNQGEVFEVARLLQDYKIKFHFVGNQAVNFKSYWEPLMNDKPDNCIIWGERSDTHKFYKAADLFYFSSKLELNPLVIKEALSYNLPSIFRKLPTYLDKYDDNPLVTYIDGDNTKTKDLILEKVQPTNITSRVTSNELYNDVIQNKSNIVKVMNRVDINYVNGPTVNILGNTPTTYTVQFIDKKTDTVHFETQIKNNHWAKCNIQYYIDWEILIWDGDNLYHTEDFNATNKRVYIAINSKALGDTLAWVPYVEKFQKVHNCQMIVSTFHNNLLKEQYPDTEFVNPGDNVTNLYAMYSVGLFYNDDSSINKHKNPTNPIEAPLQQVASDILGLKYVEIKPKLEKKNPEKEKLVTIAIHSTAQAKYWNNPTGWQEVVDWLKERGYRVKLLSKEDNGFMGNKEPTGIEKDINSSLTTVMEDLEKSEAFIGISSGLSWLSWAMETTTVLISGFTYDWTEMEDCIRIGAPKNTCAGCFNRERLNASDWNWCPDHKGTDRQFECTKLITGQMVTNELQKIL